MKTGKSLPDLLRELATQAEQKKDLVVPTDRMEMCEETSQIHIQDHGQMPLTDHAHTQMAQRLKIPTKYYERMRTDAPEILAHNVNHWLHEEPENRMVRTLNGGIRAILSDRYHRIDNDRIMLATMNAFNDYADGDIQVVSADVTDRRLYINARFPKLEDAVAVGDPVQMGVTISNSEIGGGALCVRPLLYRLVCTNGMVAGTEIDSNGMRRRHLGGRVAGNEDYSIYSDETLEADDKALMLKIRDTIKQLSDPQLFSDLMVQMTQANRTSVIEHPVAAVEELRKRTALTQGEAENVLESLLRGDPGLGVNLTKWGMANAVTNIANTVDSYDRSQELMEVGGRIIDMPTREWETLAKVA